MAGAILKLDSPKRRLAALLALALGVRIVWWLVWIVVIENEGAEYARMAENLVAGRFGVGLLEDGINTAIPPLYPLLIGGVSLVVGNAELAGRLISLLAGLGLVAAVYLLTRRIFDERTAIVAGALVALHPVLVALSVSVFSESLALCLLFVGAYFATGAMQNGSLPHAAAAGLAFGLGSQTRPEAIAFAGVASVFVCGSVLRRRRGWLPALRAGALPLVLAILIAVPYTVYLSRLAGHFQWEGKSAVIEILNARMRKGMSYAEASHGLGGDGVDEGPYLKADQVAFLRMPSPGLAGKLREVVAAAPHRGYWTLNVMWRARYLGAPLIMVLALIGLAGLVGGPWGKTNREAGALLLTFGVLLGALLLTVEYQFARYFFGLVPAAAPWVGAALVLLGGLVGRLSERALPDWSRARVSTAIGLAGVLCVAAWSLPAIPHAHELNETRDATVKQTGKWIREQTRTFRESGKRPLIMGLTSAIPYYADGLLTLLPYAEPTRALAYIRRKAPDYIVLRASDRTNAPYVTEWLKQGIPESCAVPVFEARSSDSVAVRVWRWDCPREVP
jgi:4-amino-4-deoxy-L-arabinose transferase-like glycosyltransferase